MEPVLYAQMLPVASLVRSVAFVLSGYLAGVRKGLDIMGVLILALLTATGGGIIRDLLVNEVPEVLYGGFCGSVALLLGVAIYLLHLAGWVNPARIAAVFAGVVALRLMAYRLECHRPKVE